MKPGLVKTVLQAEAAVVVVGAVTAVDAVVVVAAEAAVATGAKSLFATPSQSHQPGNPVDGSSPYAASRCVPGAIVRQTPKRLSARLPIGMR